MNEILNDKHLAILHKVQEHLPTAVIAGGAACDLYFNRPFKDVDIFISLNQLKKKVTIPLDLFFDEVFPESLGIDLGGEDSYERASTGLGSSFSEYVDFIYDARIQQTKYQFILTANVFPRILNSFDLNICKIFHTGEELKTTKDFIAGIESKEVVSLDESPKSLMRISRFLEKYPEFHARKDQAELIKRYLSKPKISKQFTFTTGEPMFWGNNNAAIGAIPQGVIIDDRVDPLAIYQWQVGEPQQHQNPHPAPPPQRRIVPREDR